MSGRPRIGVSRYVDPSASAPGADPRESSGPTVLVSRMSSPGAFGAISSTHLLDRRLAEGRERTTVLHDLRQLAERAGDDAARRRGARSAPPARRRTRRPGRRVVSALAMGSPIAPRPTTPTVLARAPVRFGPTLGRLEEQAGVEELLGVDVRRHAAELDVRLLGVADPLQDVTVLVGLQPLGVGVVLLVLHLVLEVGELGVVLVGQVVHLLQRALGVLAERVVDLQPGADDLLDRRLVLGVPVVVRDPAVADAGVGVVAGVVDLLGALARLVHAQVERHPQRHGRAPARR